MATATVARPAQALRQRRDAPRPGQAKRSVTVTDGVDQGANKRRRLNEPYVRDSTYILKKHKGKPPSLVMHLHPTHFRFDGQDGSFAYDSPMRFVLEHMRRQTVPHQMLEELLAEGVPFYDGCLIVEVHNHRDLGSEGSKSRKDVATGAEVDKFSMHVYNEHIVPSPMVPYPQKAKMEMSEVGAESNAVESSAVESNTGSMAAPERPSSREKELGKEGPKITTLVLHPTQLSRHHELLILANTPASEARGKKKSLDGAAPSSAQPATPVSVPPTPLTATARGFQSQKMCLEEADFYTFQSDLLVATEPPLFLSPVQGPKEAEAVLRLLSHPLHSDKPPSPKTRKRTTAEMAADDAQAAETERRMLIMDERIKPSARSGAGAATNENQSAAASLGFSRFKTLEMVRQKHEEQERTKKEEEARDAMEKKQAEEAMQQQQRLLAANKQREMAQQSQRHAGMMAQQQNNQRQEQLRMQQQMMEAQRQAQINREHAHPQQNGMLQNQQANAFPTSVPQSSPVVRQQTPLINSSPMLPNGGFPMAPTSSQGAGSPPRPTSAAMHNRNVAMARQLSQQQHGSQSNTPVLPQGNTPNMAQVIPNRQMTQTPRMPPGSPAAMMQNTPTSSNMHMATPNFSQQNQLTPEQMQMLQQQSAHNQRAMNHPANGMHAGSPPHGMTPEQIQNIRAQQYAKAQAMAQAQGQAGQNPQMTAILAQQHQHQQQQQQQLRRLQAAQQQHQMRMQVQAAQQQQQHHNGPSASPQPGGNVHPQATPQMNHAHPQTPHPLPQNTPNGGMQPNVPMTPQQQAQQQIQIAQAQQKANQIAAARFAQAQQVQQVQHQLNQVAQQYGSWANIPAQVIENMTPAMRSLLNQQARKQAQLRTAHAMQARNQMATGPNGGMLDQQVPAGQPNPQYMQMLRANQQQLLQAQQQMQQQQMHGQVGQGGQGNMMNGMGMNMNMGAQYLGAGGAGGGGGGGNDLAQHFANMQNALNQQRAAGAGQQQQQQQQQQGGGGVGGQ